MIVKTHKKKKIVKKKDQTKGHRKEKQTHLKFSRETTWKNIDTLTF